MKAKVLPVVLTETWFELVNLKMNNQNNVLSHCSFQAPYLGGASVWKRSWILFSEIHSLEG